MKGKIVLLLFALPFFGVGVWMTYSIGSNIAEHLRMQDWMPVQGKLIRAGYETHVGDDSNSYEAYAEYSYTLNGRNYVGDRVAIGGGADNVGEFQRELGNRLSGIMSRGQSVAIYVNPEDPAEAIVDRSLRWGLMGFKAIFMLVFGGIGLGMLIYVVVGKKQRDPSAPEFADAPWLANNDWQSSTVKSSSKVTMYAMWGFAAVWNLISAPLPFVVYREVLQKDNTIALVGLLFPLVGLGLIYWAVLRTLEWQRFGAAPVTLDPFPGSIDGHVGGTIDLNYPYDAGAAFSLTLTSLRSYVSGSGKNRSRKESANWQKSQVAHTTLGPKGTRLSFRFDVPENLQESDADQSKKSYFLWRLNLKADLPGTDVDRDYEIPVYATRQSSRDLSNFAIEEARDVQAHLDEVAISKLARISHTMSGKSMLYPMGRNVYNGIVGSVFGAVFAGAGWFLLNEQQQYFLGGCFGLAGSGVLLAGLYFILNSLEIRLQGANLSTVRRIMGFPIKRRSMRRDEFSKFSQNSSFQTQSGGKYVMHYSVHAIDRQGNKMIVGEGFRGAGQADAAARVIAREFGLKADARDDRLPAEIDGENLLAPDA